jgi:KamA family protein
MDSPKYITKLYHISQLSAAEQEELKEVGKKFVFRSNEYYQSLIDWDDPNDPIRRIVVPANEELNDWGKLDVSDEGAYTVVAGLEHKYRETALLLVNDVCGAYCRFCFRKRLFMSDNNEAVRDITDGLEYIKQHGEVTNVLLTGGDPLILSTEKLESIISRIRKVDHVKIIRIGTKIPAHNPYRIINDPSLLKMIEMHSTDLKKIYIMTHFNHPKELTEVAITSLNMLQKVGAVTTNQTPLIRGINDDPSTLAALLNLLSFIGVPAYYIFQCRPTLGNKPYSVPLEEAYSIFAQAHASCSGLAKRARFVMSHTTGKIEVVGLTDEKIFMRYHQAACPDNASRFLVFQRNPNARWFDDYSEAALINQQGRDGLYSMSANQ